ncbi:hypothetical protein FRC02_002368 [Tulasnella sp. 418]|nr:hypothetical protein FRC02_002368 [Tulasnella sp. 418]
MPQTKVKTAAEQCAEWDAIEDAKQAAIMEYFAQEQKPKHERRGLRPISEEFGICYRTLGRLVKGGRSIHQLIESKQLLSLAEEDAITEYAIGMAVTSL